MTKTSDAETAAEARVVVKVLTKYLPHIIATLSLLGGGSAALVGFNGRPSQASLIQKIEDLQVGQVNQNKILLRIEFTQSGMLAVMTPSQRDKVQATVAASYATLRTSQGFIGGQP